MFLNSIYLGENAKCYLSPILDMHTNEVISYDLSLSPNMEQIRRMLEKGLSKFSSLNGLIFHSDQGWQYQHAYFRKAIEKRGIIQSMSRKGNCYDNSIMETFFGRLKNEMFYGCEKEYKSYEEFSTAMAKYIDYYNNERIQAKTKWMPPGCIVSMMWSNRISFRCRTTSLTDFMSNFFRMLWIWVLTVPWDT